MAVLQALKGKWKTFGEFADSIFHYLVKLARQCNNWLCCWQVPCNKYQELGKVQEGCSRRPESTHFKQRSKHSKAVEEVLKLWRKQESVKRVPMWSWEELHFLVSKPSRLYIRDQKREMPVDRIWYYPDRTCFNTRSPSAGAWPWGSRYAITPSLQSCSTFPSTCTLYCYAEDHWQRTSYDDRNWQQILSNRYFVNTECTWWRVMRMFARIPYFFWYNLLVKRDLPVSWSLTRILPNYFS